MEAYVDRLRDQACQAGFDSLPDGGAGWNHWESVQMRIKTQSGYV